MLTRERSSSISSRNCTRHPIVISKHQHTQKRIEHSNSQPVPDRISSQARSRSGHISQNTNEEAVSNRKEKNGNSPGYRQIHIKFTPRSSREVTNKCFAETVGPHRHIRQTVLQQSDRASNDDRCYGPAQREAVVDRENQRQIEIPKNAYPVCQYSLNYDNGDQGERELTNQSVGGNQILHCA